MTRPLSPTIIRELLHYDAETGVFHWRQRDVSMFKNNRAWKTWNAKFANRRAFMTRQGDGYYMGRVFRVGYCAHRIAWCYVHGEWPSEEIDHINGDRQDNRIKNLRSVSRGENAKNIKRRQNNSSGITGVEWHKCSQKWMARIKVDGHRIYLGCFSNKSDAIAARMSAQEQYGFSPRHGTAA